MTTANNLGSNFLVGTTPAAGRDNRRGARLPGSERGRVVNPSPPTPARPAPLRTVAVAPTHVCGPWECQSGTRPRCVNCHSVHPDCRGPVTYPRLAPAGQEIG